MFWSLLFAKGEELIKTEGQIMRTLSYMFTDNNWRVRRDAALYLYEFLKELHKIRNIQRGMLGSKFNVLVDTSSSMDVSMLMMNGPSGGANHQ